MPTVTLICWPTCIKKLKFCILVLGMPVKSTPPMKEFGQGCSREERQAKKLPAHLLSPGAYGWVSGFAQRWRNYVPSWRLQFLVVPFPNSRDQHISWPSNTVGILHGSTNAGKITKFFDSISVT